MDDTNPQQNTDPQQPIDTLTYTGVLIGSTGAYQLNLTENGANASVVFDDEIYHLSSSETLANGQSLTLTDGTISLTIEVDENGAQPVISFTIPGHDIQATVVLSNPKHPNQDYIGWTERTKYEVKTYRTTFNLTLHEDNGWTGMERVDLDIDPGNLNHQSAQGQVTRVSGTFTESDSRISLFWSNDRPELTLFKVGDRLSLYHAAGGTFQVDLVQVN
ncbi:MAG: hypothetical protein AAF985_07240 [Bacteroidota bacterium]